MRRANRSGNAGSGRSAFGSALFVMIANMPITSTNIHINPVKRGYVQPKGDEREMRSVPIFVSLMNTSEKRVTGLILKFTNKGWVSSDLMAESYSVIAFAGILVPYARAIVATRTPVEPWMEMFKGRGATGNIVRVWYA